MKKSFKTLFYSIVILLCGALVIYSCKKANAPLIQSNNQAQSTDKGQGQEFISETNQPTDKNATPETVSLFQYLISLRNNKILFGHQDELIVGSRHYKYKGGSDTYDMIQDYPALYGYDLGNLEQDKPMNKANISFDSIKATIEGIYAKGGVITLDWAVDNPIDPSQGHRGDGVQNTINKLFANQENLNLFNTWLDRLATFFNNLKTPDGTLIPVIFRPYHECNGTWFWWGKGNDKNTAQEFIKLYQYTVDYLRSKNVHNVLYAYCTGRFKSEEKFLERYPGDNYVDVLGFDIYDKISNYPSNTIEDEFKQLCDIVTSVAESKGKICAVTETGMRGMPIQDWWTSTLYNAIKNSGISYVMIWGNYGKSSSAYYGTFQGQVSENDFITFSHYKNITFLSSLSNTIVYH